MAKHTRQSTLPTISGPVRIKENKPFSDADGFRARFKGVSGVVNAGQLANIDIQITEERYINGVRLILTDHANGDFINFEIVDKDGLVAPAGTVLDRFGETWYVDDTVKTQPDVVVPYPAKIPAGFYIRIAYTSVGVNNVNVKANMYLHWKQA